MKLKVRVAQDPPAELAGAGKEPLSARGTSQPSSARETGSARRGGPSPFDAAAGAGEHSAPDAGAAAAGAAGMGRSLSDEEVAWQLHQELNAAAPVLRTRSRRPVEASLNAKPQPSGGSDPRPAGSGGGVAGASPRKAAAKQAAPSVNKASGQGRAPTASGDSSEQRSERSQAALELAPAPPPRCPRRRPRPRPAILSPRRRRQRVSRVRSPIARGPRRSRRRPRPRRPAPA